MGNVGSTQPKNRTGRKVTHQKLENAKKTKILSLQQHNLDDIPDAVFQIKTLRTLDVSNNHLKRLSPKLATLVELKIFNCDDNQLGSLAPISSSSLTKLQTLSAGGNRLGKPAVNKEGTTTKPTATVDQQAAFPPSLPSSLKILKLNSNFLSSVPRSICVKSMTKLEKLDLSHNQLASIPSEISLLVNLNEINLDNNMIVSLPEDIGKLSKLKTLSLCNNQIRVDSVHFSSKHPQPLPASLFTSTPLIDLNLHGNPMTSTQLNQFEGIQEFLERRQKVKTTALYGGAKYGVPDCQMLANICQMLANICQMFANFWFDRFQMFARFCFFQKLANI
jgi:Leucine-rich repeat (LRR) protein